MMNYLHSAVKEEEFNDPMSIIHQRKPKPIKYSEEVKRNDVNICQQMLCIFCVLTDFTKLKTNVSR